MSEHTSNPRVPASTPLKYGQSSPGPDASGSDTVPVWLKGLVGLLVLAVVAASGLLVWTTFRGSDGSADALTKGERDVILAQAQVSESPNSYQARLALARAYLLADEYAQVIGEADKALELESRAVEAHVLKGQAYEEMGEVADAEAEYRAVLELVPDQYAANYRLAEIYVQQGRLDDAEAQLQALLEGTPLAADGMVLLGQIYEEQGKVEQARAEYERALSFVPDYEEALAGLERLPTAAQ